MDDCLFCKIIAGDIPSTKVYEDEYVYAFRDINPQAPVHVLVVPKEHIACADEINESNSIWVARCYEAIAKIAKAEGLVKRLPRHQQLRRGRRPDRHAPAFPPSRRHLARHEYYLNRQKR